MSDLNSKHRSWNNLKANSAGAIIFNELSARPFNVLHSQSPTYYPPQKGRKPSNIDIILTKDLHHTSQVTSSDGLMSDHRAIEFSIDYDINFKGKATKDYRYDLADWDVFKTILSEGLDLDVPLDTVEAIDDAVSNLTKISLEQAVKKETCPSADSRSN